MRKITFFIILSTILITPIFTNAMLTCVTSTSGTSNCSTINNIINSSTSTSTFVSIPSTSVSTPNSTYTSNPQADNSQINKQIADLEARIVKLETDNIKLNEKITNLESQYNVLFNFIKLSFAQLLQTIKLFIK